MPRAVQGTVPVKIDAYFFGISVTLSVVVRFMRSKRFSKALFFYFEELSVTTRQSNKLVTISHVMCDQLLRPFSKFRFSTM